MTTINNFEVKGEILNDCLMPPDGEDESRLQINEASDNASSSIIALEQAIQHPSEVAAFRHSNEFDFEEDYISVWHKNQHGSIDLDEKLTSMTGSYSEILDERSYNEPAPGNILTSEDAYMNTMEELCTSLDDKRKASISNMEIFKGGEGATPKIPSHDSQNSRVTWIENNPEDNLCSLIRDFSEKNFISKRKENNLRGFNSAPHNMPRSLLYPPLPPIDPTTISDLEERARDIATSMDTLIENLTGTLHSISALSVECVETYRDAVCKTCDAVDSNIKSMYQLMAKCEELSKSMKPIYKLHDQIREIRRLLDLFEGVVFSSSGGLGSGGGGGGGT